MRSIPAVLLAVSLVCVAAPPKDEARRVVVHPEDTGEALVNPDMGWTLHFYSNFIENYGSSSSRPTRSTIGPACR